MILIKPVQNTSLQLVLLKYESFALLNGLFQKQYIKVKALLIRKKFKR